MSDGPVFPDAKFITWSVQRIPTDEYPAALTGFSSAMKSWTN
jgi:hypothetical protein